MHHTDYNTNLPKSQHNSTKKCSTSHGNAHRTSNSVSQRKSENVGALVAIGLILIALLQMDPANANGTVSEVSYGSLQLTQANKQPSIGTAAKMLDNKIKVSVSEQLLELDIEQRFSTPGVDNLIAEYVLPLPLHAKLQWLQVVAGDQEVQCIKRVGLSQKRCTRLAKASVGNSKQIIAGSTRSNSPAYVYRTAHDLRVPVHLLSPGIVVTVNLSVLLPSATFESDAEQIRSHNSHASVAKLESVKTVVELINPSITIRPDVVPLPL